MNRMRSYRFAFAVCVLGAMAPTNSSAQTFKTVASLTGSESPNYLVSLVQGVDGNLYGTSEFGGAYGSGSVFSVTPTGTVTTLYSFCSQPFCPDGAAPYAGLVQAANGDLYGTTTFGADSCGTVFKITTGGSETTVSDFPCGDGAAAQPAGALVQAVNGSFYGTTGSQDGYISTVFDVSPTGVNTLWNFDEQPNDGSDPNALMQATNGDLYGTTQIDGQYGYGTIFETSQQGSFTTLYGLTGGADGGEPVGTLVQASDGNLYGTTTLGGPTSTERSLEQPWMAS